MRLYLVSYVRNVLILRGECVNYSINDIVEIINSYSVNINNIYEHNNDDDMESVGVAVLTSQPSAPGVSDQVANQAIKRVNNGLIFAEMKTDIKYLHQRLHRVTNERQAQILNLRLQGHSASDISEVIGVSRSTIYNQLKIIAGIIGQV